MTRLGRRGYRSEREGSMFLLAVVILVVSPALGASLVERSQTAVDRPIPANLVVYCCSDVVSVQFSGNASYSG